MWLLRIDTFVPVFKIETGFLIMNKRININNLQPGAFTAMYGLEDYVIQTGLDPILIELIRNRVSQINGCRYCMDMHTKESVKLGDTEQRISGLRSWREATDYTEKERASLALAEEITNISQGVADDTYANAVKVFDEVSLAQVIMVIVTINAWNRIVRTTY
jgi:AhpD family alkylhydroperoxidase